MNRSLLAVVVFILGLAACKSNKNSTGKYASDRSIHIEFHPFWGGAAICDLTRKKGKDALFYEYDQKIDGKDSVTRAYVTITQQQADSVFSIADKVNWTQAISNGTAGPKVGLKISVTYKKRVPQTLSWEQLQSAEELPGDVKLLILELNTLAPDEFKIY